MSRFGKDRPETIAAAVLVLFLLSSFGPAAFAYEEVKVEKGGTVSGTVKFSGSPPPPQKREVARDQQVCGTEPKTSDALLVSSTRGIKNVVVYLEGVKAGKPFSNAPVELDQRGCWFIPHVVLVRAGHPFTLLNSDGVLHNFRTPGSSVNPALNKAQPRFKRRLSIQIDNPDIIHANCDVHEWMSSIIVVMAHPYYALTDENGAFSLSDIPPGRYTLTFWHEVVGKQTREVVATAGGEATVAVELKGK